MSVFRAFENGQDADQTNLIQARLPDHSVVVAPIDGGWQM